MKSVKSIVKNLSGRSSPQLSRDSDEDLSETLCSVLDKKEPQGMEERRELKPVRLNQFRHGLDDGLVVSACEDAPASDWFLL